MDGQGESVNEKLTTSHTLAGREWIRFLKVIGSARVRTDVCESASQYRRSWSAPRAIRATEGAVDGRFNSRPSM
jgi:hypothetical protein